jgi:hypothetical protein
MSNGTVRVDIRGPGNRIELDGPADRVFTELEAADLIRATDADWRGNGGALEYPRRVIRAAPTTPAADFRRALAAFFSIGLQWFEVAPLDDAAGPALTLAFSINAIMGGSPPPPWYFEIPRRLDGEAIRGEPRLRIELPVAPKDAGVQYRYRPIVPGLLQRYNMPAFDAPIHVFKRLDRALAEIPTAMWGDLLFILHLPVETTFGDAWEVLRSIHRAGGEYAVIIPGMPATVSATIEIDIADADGGTGWFERYALEVSNDK